jgi:O-antigen/teichoic acid export membrane protein
MSLAIMVLKFGYRPRFLVTMPAVRRMFAFAGANYIANCLNVLPTMVLPIIVFNRLGEAASGYYYLSFMIANLLYTVAYSVTQSLFAEGSYLEQSLSSLVRRAVLILAVVMVPASIVLALVPRRLLLLFGGGYSANAATTLAVLALAAPGVAIYSMAVVLLRIQDHIVAIVAMNVVYCLAILGLAQAWCRRGLVWVAVAWLVGQLVAGVLGLVLAWRRRLSTAQPSATARNAEPAVS